MEGERKEREGIMSKNTLKIPNFLHTRNRSNQVNKPNFTTLFELVCVSQPHGKLAGSEGETSPIPFSCRLARYLKD